MDKGQRQRYKTLANDAIIASLGYDSQLSRLATALETCVDWIDDIATECEHCKTCEYHGDFTDDSIPIDAGEVMGVHREMTASLKSLNDFHKKLSDQLAEDFADSSLPNELAEIIEEIEQQADDLQGCVVT